MVPHQIHLEKKDSKPSQKELVSKLKFLSFKISYNSKHNSYLCSTQGFIFQIFTGLILAWCIKIENKEQQIIDYNMQSILTFMEKNNANEN